MAGPQGVCSGSYRLTFWAQRTSCTLRARWTTGPWEARSTSNARSTLSARAEDRDIRRTGKKGLGSPGGAGAHSSTHSGSFGSGNPVRSGVALKEERCPCKTDSSA